MHRHISNRLADPRRSNDAAGVPFRRRHSGCVDRSDQLRIVRSIALATIGKVTMQIRSARRLLGTPVRSSDGRPLGRVGVVYIPEGRVQPLLIALPAERSAPWVVPLFGARLDEDGLVLAYRADLITAGPTVDAEIPLSLGEVGAVLTHYRPGIAMGFPVTRRAPEVGDVGAGLVHRIPPVPGVEDDDLPPIVIINPGATG
ncbi:hypothetical protein ACQP00_28485 [Dactylosporangium sp. CS-047395]|uniref:hypothetical protein n=1 Tax=Dactylosporangium sp. CS-047395 TaxID=3239936 RepID=UPI003D8C7CE7